MASGSLTRYRSGMFRLITCIRASISLGIVCTVALGCGDDSNSEEIRAARLNEGCLLDSDCVDPYVCVFRKCHKECGTTKDCPDGERCVLGEEATNVCQADMPCAYNSDCPGDQVCGVDGKCRDQCSTDRDCVENQTCSHGTCAEDDELVNGTLPETDAGVSEGTPCIYNSECPLPLACVDGKCLIECREDRDCTYGLLCYQSRCSLPSAVPDAGN